MDCLTDEAMMALTEGLVPEEALPAIRSHLQVCAPCTALFQFMTTDSVAGSEMQASRRQPDRSVGAAPGVLRRLQPGEQVQRYQIVSWLGAGGMGVVYAAYDTQLRREVAIKLLRSEGAEHTSALHRRMLREAQILAQFSHENVVAVHDMGVFEDHVFIVMEFISGSSLQERLRQWRSQRAGPQTAAVLQLARQIVSALCAAHQKQIVHRDLKPSNIMLVDDPVHGVRVKVLDFGLAKRTAGPAVVAPAASSSEALLSTGLFLGTPLYASPEQCRADPIDGKADVYSLGVILYEMLSGDPPFLGDPHTLLQQHRGAEAAPLSQRAPSLPAPLCRLVHDMLRKEPAQRPTMEQVRERLASLPAQRERRPPKGRLLTRAVVASLVLAAACAALMLLRWRHGPLSLRSLRAPRGMAYIPGGTFTMGSTTREIEAAYLWSHSVGCSDCPKALFEREQPQRQVQVSPFYLDAKEVTNADFAAWLNRHPGVRIVAGETKVLDAENFLIDLYPKYGIAGLEHQKDGYSAREGYERKPVTQVTWGGALLYCQEHGKRLPTEAEWEFAARGTPGWRFPWGNLEPRCEHSVFGRPDKHGCFGLGYGPEEVGSARQDRTPEGVYDLGGNVAEWLMDTFRLRYPLCPAPCRDTVVADNTAEDGGPDVHVVRGGAWYRTADATRSAGRSRQKKNDVMGDIGFRCARSWAK